MSETPDEIFTPRSAEINSRVYVPRPELEEELTEALTESQHLVIFGESGNGKTWLYKRVFAKKNVHWAIINLAQASLLGSLPDAFRNQIERLGRSSIDSESLKGAGAAKFLGSGFDASWEKNFVFGKKEPFEELLSFISETGGKKLKILVFDNFEQIVQNEAICKQVADCVMLLDDPVYSSYGVKLCIVGVPSGIEDALAKHGHIETISSRLKEIPEVARMTESEAKALVKLGLEDILKLQIIGDKEKFYKEILWVTDRIALELQEFGLKLSKEAFKNGKKIDRRVFNIAKKKWLNNSLKANIAAVVSRLNSRETKAARRNQCIFACGMLKMSNFTYRDVEEEVRLQFPEDTKDVVLNISGELSGLTKGDNPILKRMKSDESYRFTNPKYKMVVRSILEKTDNGRVKRIDLDD